MSCHSNVGKRGRCDEPTCSSDEIMPPQKKIKLSHHPNIDQFQQINFADYLYVSHQDNDLYNPNTSRRIAIPFIENYLSKRKCIAFPINPILVHSIGRVVHYFCGELVGCNSKNKVMAVRPIHILAAIESFTIGAKSIEVYLKSTTNQLMHPALTEICSHFYHFVDKMNNNRINYAQFRDALRKLNIDSMLDSVNEQGSICKRLFTEMDAGNKEFITIDDWNNYNKNDRCFYGVMKAKSILFNACTLIFDTLNQSQQRVIKLRNLQSEVRNDLQSYFKSISCNNEIQRRLRGTAININKLVDRRNDKYQHPIREYQITDDNNLSTLNGNDVYRIIFSYLPYNDLLNGVCKINGIPYYPSLNLLDEAYSRFAYHGFFNDLIDDWSIFYKRQMTKDCVMILNAILVDLLNNIIDQFDIRYKAKEMYDTKEEFVQGGIVEAPTTRNLIKDVYCEFRGGRYYTYIEAIFDLWIKKIPMNEIISRF